MHGAVNDDREGKNVLKFKVQFDGAAGDVASADSGVNAVRGIGRAAWTMGMAVEDGNALRQLEQSVIQRGGNLTGAAARTRNGFSVNQHGRILVASALAIGTGHRVKIENISRLVGAVDIIAADADIFHAPQIQFGAAQRIKRGENRDNVAFLSVIGIGRDRFKLFDIADVQIADDTFIRHNGHPS